MDVRAVRVRAVRVRAVRVRAVRVRAVLQGPAEGCVIVRSIGRRTWFATAVTPSSRDHVDPQRRELVSQVSLFF